ncbi:MAG: hypothetical protein JKY24_02715 [Pseudomonadales bacterium]|nr:hypothetical protein [Pseudomonadales bacterium]
MKHQARVYQTNMAMGASTLEQVISTYNVAIAACRNKNSIRVCDALCVLLKGVRHKSNTEIAKQLCLFYRDCEVLIVQQHFDEVESMLLTVRETWCNVNLELKKQSPKSNIVNGIRFDNSDKYQPFSVLG